MTMAPTAHPGPAPADELLAFIDASPTPHHAAARVVERLEAAGFTRFDPARDRGRGARYVLGSTGGPDVADGAVVAWVDAAAPAAPTRMIGAHTDSPNLRLRPRPDTGRAGLRQLAVEVYGGALLNSWLDRDLLLAGRVALRAGDGVRHVRYRSDRPLLRVPQLAIHLDRQIGTDGLRLSKQQHMTPVWALGSPTDGDFARWLAAELGVTQRDVLGWDLACVDAQPGARIGRDAELVAVGRLDNLCSCFGAVEALAAAAGGDRRTSAVAVLYDHEEVGSTTARGADSAWLSRILELRAAALGLDRAAHLAEIDATLLLSADMAHATHPNYPERHESGHWVRMGGGPVVKHNVNARYATDSVGAAAFRLAAEAAGVPVQDYSHHGDLPCGSTIGPLAGAQLAVHAVDVGMAQLSMHSARELMAADDVELMLRAFTAWFDPPA
jgi:aspartyl aminopeptidase